MENRGIIDPETAKSIEAQLLKNDQEVKKILMVVKNNKVGQTITSNLANQNLEFDYVDIIQIGEVVP